MIDYETYCKIIQLRRSRLRPSQIASMLNIHEQTVRHWLQEECYRRKKPTKRSGKSDPYKPQILRRLEKYPYSSKQIFQRLQELGYQGGITSLCDYVKMVRPAKQKGFQPAFSEIQRPGGRGCQGAGEHPGVSKGHGRSREYRPF